MCTGPLYYWRCLFLSFSLTLPFLEYSDIKPDNLLLDTEGNCHLTDFNLSVKLPEEGIRGIAGTRPYMGTLIKLRYVFIAISLITAIVQLLRCSRRSCTLSRLIGGPLV